MNGDEATATTADDENGNPGYYRFDNLADGTHVVSEECPDVGPAWVQTEPPDGGVCGAGTRDVTVAIDNRIQVADFGNGHPDLDVTKACTEVVEVADDIEYELRGDQYRKRKPRQRDARRSHRGLQSNARTPRTG